jgi:hypothetical protein
MAGNGKDCYEAGSPPISLSQAMASEHFSRFSATANQTVNTAF